MRFEECLAFTCKEEGLDPDRERSRLLTLYWKPLRCDELLAGVDLMLFDLAAKVGSVGGAVAMLQSAVGLQSTGVMDDHTVRWSRVCSGLSLIDDLAGRQRALASGDAERERINRRELEATQALISASMDIDEAHLQPTI